MRDNAAGPRGFQRRFTHIFVDEFQDTDPLQAEILLLLAADDPRRDRLATRQRRCPASCSSSAIPKQSIYRFRRADVGIYGRSASGSQRGRQHVVHLTHELPQRAGDPGVS